MGDPLARLAQMIGDGERPRVAGAEAVRHRIFGPWLVESIEAAQIALTALARQNSCR